jgi:peroxiredoxin
MTLLPRRSVFAPFAMLLPPVGAAPKSEFKSDGVVPRYAPTLQLIDSTGRPFRLMNYYGKAVALIFSLPSCVNCQATAKALQVLHERYVKEGFSAVCILIDSPSHEKAAEFGQSLQLRFPVVAAQEREQVRDFLGLKLGKQSVQMPQVLLLDRWQRIRHQFGGENAIYANNMELNFEGLAKQLIAERPRTVAKRGTWAPKRK